MRLMAEQKHVWDYRTVGEASEIGGDLLFRLVRALGIAESFQLRCCQVTPQQGLALLACRLRCCDDSMEHGSIRGRKHSDPVTVREVAAGLGVSTAVASRMITTLEQDGLVYRSFHPRDRRRICVQPTPKGQKLIRKVEAGYRRIWAKVFARIRDGELPAFMKTLGNLVDVAEDVRVEVCRG